MKERIVMHRNVKLFSYAHLTGAILYTELIIACLKLLFGTTVDIFNATVILYVINTLLNIWKFYLSIPVLDELCPHGAQSLYIEQKKNYGTEILVRIVNFLIQKSIYHVAHKNIKGKLLLTLLGIAPGITVTGILLSALNHYSRGMFWVLLGEAIRVFGFSIMLGW